MTYFLSAFADEVKVIDPTSILTPLMDAGIRRYIYIPYLGAQDRYVKYLPITQMPGR